MEYPKLLFVFLFALTVMFANVKADNFDDLDTDGNGLIDSQELQDGYGMSEIVANSYISAYDTNGDGGVDRGEFKKAPL